MKEAVVQQSPKSGILRIVATPIGNLEDISLRALKTLAEADIVAAEDTRHSLRLLSRHGIHARLVSYHRHNEARRTAALIEDLKGGASVALITDAGMPGISDPGQRLLQACLAEGIPHEVIPGPSAVITALVGSGLPSERFFFGAFLPTKKGQRGKELSSALQRRETSVYFESPHRILSTLEILEELDPARLICLAREMTKKFEEFARGSVKEIRARFLERAPKGEFTLVIAGTDLPKWLHKG